MARLKHAPRRACKRHVIQGRPTLPGRVVRSSGGVRNVTIELFRCAGPPPANDLQERRACTSVDGAAPHAAVSQPIHQGVSRPMRKLSVIAVPLAAALAAGAVAVSSGSGSSHREAPPSALHPTADDTDVYAFTAPDAPGDLTIVSNWIPFEDPAGGPNFYRFDDRARYYLNVDNTGDGVYDIRFRFRFRTSVGDPNSFLYAAPTVDSIDSPNLNVKQTYSVVREDLSNGQPVHENALA